MINNLNENNTTKENELNLPETEQIKLSIEDEICYLRSSGCDWASISKHYGKSERWCRKLIEGKMPKPEPNEALDKLYSSMKDPMFFINFTMPLYNPINKLTTICTAQLSL